VALEIHLPQLVGSFLLEVMAGVGRRILARLDLVIARQDPMRRGRRGGHFPIPLQTMVILRAPPGGMLVANSQHLCLDGSGGAALGHCVATTGAIRATLDRQLANAPANCNSHQG
jgi:hypothetical protein